jgi:hypothetical protein
MFLDYIQSIALYYCTSYTGSDTNHNPMAPHRNRVQVQQYSVPFAVCYAARRTVQLYLVTPPSFVAFVVTTL